MQANRVFIIMGVSGSGKTTIGQLLSERLSLPFYDADDFHPQSNIDKMKNGEALVDEDRWLWLSILAEKINTWSQERGAILACSALKENYRNILSSNNNKAIQWIHLFGEYDIILERMGQRVDHFMSPKMLLSQFNTLENPNYGIHVDLKYSPDEIIENIMEKLDEPIRKSNIGLIGLGVMGKALSLNIADKSYEISVYNRNDPGEEFIVDNFTTENSCYSNLRGYTDLKSFVQSIDTPRVILVMIKAGKPIDQVCDQLLPLLSVDDIIIDGGNSHFQDTERRSSALLLNGIHFVGCGVSGGEKGARYGPSIMPGGTTESYKTIGPILESIAATNYLGQPCCTHIGPGGSGHFIKMVHNGIEYAEMQLLTEVYAILSNHLNKDEISSVLKEWNDTDLKSYLLEITAKIIGFKENGEYLLDKILDKAGNKGTGSWSSKAAFDLGSINTMMSSAVFARYISSLNTKRIELSQKIDSSIPKGNIDIDFLMEAYAAARIINHQQGFELIRHASITNEWDLNLSKISAIWTNGCIIRSTLMRDCVEYFKDNNQLIDVAKIFNNLKKGESKLIQVIAYGLNNRLSLPCFYAAYNYFISMTTGTLSANLIQAQRDYFGAHTYQRNDLYSNDFFHTIWE